MMTRRNFIKTVGLSVAASQAAVKPAVFGQSRSSKRKMTMNLVCGSLGVKATQRQAIEYAYLFGFESVEARPDYLATLNKGEVSELKRDLRKKRLVWGSAALGVDFRRDAAKFEEGLKELPRLATGLKRAGVKRMNTWLTPSSRELTYLQNFQRHTRRLQEVAKVLADYDLRLGLEYVGTTTSLISRKYPFIHTMAETVELVEAIGFGNVGYVLDSWHWWQAGDSAEDIEKINANSIMLVDLNDAPLGVAKQQQRDNQRELPVATGVIDTKAFLNALQKIGYAGPVRAEPFNQVLRDMEDEATCQATINSLKKAFKLINKN